MAESCVVPNCNSVRETNGERIAFFNIPENVILRNKWIRVIPKSGVPLTTTDMVCEKHFIETDIIRHYIVQDAAGKVIEKVAYDYPRLSATAVPMIFPGLPLHLNEAQVQNGPKSTSETINNTLYDYMVMDMYTNIVADAIESGASLVGKVAANHSQHKNNEPEVVARVAAEHPSENQPLLSTEALQKNSIPVNGDINGDAANISSPSNGAILTNSTKASSPVNGNDIGDTANQSTKSTIDGVISADDAPISLTQPVPIFVQPTSMFALSDRPEADITDANNDDCCGCGDDGCCDCGDCDCDCADCNCDCDCDGCVLS